MNKLWIAYVAAVLGLYAGYATAMAFYRSEAVLRGYAEYDEETGTWDWIPPNERIKNE